MRYLAITLAVIGAILIAAAAIGFFAFTHHMNVGIRTLFAIGGVSAGLGLICGIASGVRSRDHSHNV